MAFNLAPSTHDAGSDTPDVSGTKRHAARNCSESQGFVLIFTLWVTVVSALVLGFYLANHSSAPKVGEVHLAYPIQQKQLINIVNYVSGGINGFVGQRDPRTLKLAGDVVDPAFRIRKTPYRITLGEERYKITLSPISIRPDLHELNRQQMSQYLRRLGIAAYQAERLAARLVTAGGEKYRRWRDIAALPQVTSSDMRFLRRHFVLYGAHKKLDPNYADEAVIAAFCDLPVAKISQVFKDLGRKKIKDYRSVDLIRILTPLEARRFQTCVGDDLAELRLMIVHISGHGRTVEALFDSEAGSFIDFTE